MRLKFGMEPIDYTDRTCIIVVEISGTTGSALMGIVVDRVWEVSEIKEEEIQDCPKFSSRIDTDFIMGMAKKSDGVSILLDIDRILHHDEKKQMAQAA